MPAGLYDDDRLDAGRGPRGGHELARVADGLDVKQDGAGGRIEREPIEQIAEIHIRHVADRNKRGKGDATLMREGDQRGGDGARLRNHREIAGLRGHGGEGRVEANAGRDNAKAIRTNDANAGRARNFTQARRQRVRPVIGVGGDDERARHAARRGLRDEIGG